MAYDQLLNVPSLMQVYQIVDLLPSFHACHLMQLLSFDLREYQVNYLLNVARTCPLILYPLLPTAHQAFSGSTW